MDIQIKIQIRKMSHVSFIFIHMKAKYRLISINRKKNFTN